MQLYVARHGNTFAPGDKIVWAGATNDLPLVPSGLEQAAKLADYLQKNKVRPTAIYCSQLQRTRNFAKIVIEKLALTTTPTVDARLHEVDYGDWTGLSNVEVIERFGEKALEAWENESRWPQNANWGGSEMQTIAEIHSFAKELAERHAGEQVLVITSNGKLRYFLTLVESEWERRKLARDFKTKTGHLSKFQTDEAGRFQLDFWNQNPAK